jgi:hypothetical protein
MPSLPVNFPLALEKDNRLVENAETRLKLEHEQNNLREGVSELG